MIYSLIYLSPLFYISLIKVSYLIHSLNVLLNYSLLYFPHIFSYNNLYYLYLFLINIYLFPQLIYFFLTAEIFPILPLNIDISSSRLIQASRVVIPPYWVQKQLEYALDEVTPYITGDVDEFTVHIDFSDRVSSASEELELMLLEANTGEILYDGIIQPAIKGLIAEQITLPYGLELNEEDILEIMQTVAPPYWIQEQTSIAIDEFTKYIVGETDEMNLMIGSKPKMTQA